MNSVQPQPATLVEYDRSKPRVTPKQWRTLMAVMLVNCIIWACLFGPDNAERFVTKWDAWRARRESDRRAQEQQQACLDYAAPVGQVVYREVEAETLKSVGTYAGYADEHAPPMGGALRVERPKPPVCWQGFARRATAAQLQYVEPVVYLGGRKSGAGPAIVAAKIDAEQQFRLVSPGVAHSCRTTTSRYLTVSAFEAAAKGQRPKLLYEITVNLKLTETEAVLNGDGTWRSTPGSYLTLLAGQSDPNDPSHFVLPYRVDEVDGVIDGWLGEHGLVLKPRSGHPSVWADVYTTWDLSVAPRTAAATAPGGSVASTRSSAG